MQELDNWKQVRAKELGLEHISGYVWQNKEDPELLGYVHFQDTVNGDPNPKFINRIESLKGLDHPNVLKMLEYDLQAERPFMVTELCKGGTLRDVDLSTWSIKKKMNYFNQICSGFGYLWEKGLAKYDHKGMNVFLKEDHVPVLGDFEYASPIEKNADGVQEILGIMGYSFWELMEGKRFSQVEYEEYRVQQKIEELTDQLEAAKQEWAELLNK